MMISLARLSPLPSASEMLVFIFSFRKVNPSRNPIAAEHLSDSSNALNMKRVMVNAQVTAMISFIEVLFFAVYVAGVSVAGGTNSEMVVILLVMYMILYLIVSPYSFLMNTSHNKNRIIEHGWINVIKNMTIIGNHKFAVACKVPRTLFSRV